jgi:hypothetical protein
MNKVKKTSTTLLCVGVSLILTAILITTGNPEQITIITKTFTGNPLHLTKILTLTGTLTTSLGILSRKIA